MPDNVSGDPTELRQEVLRGLFDELFEGIQIIDRDWRYAYLNETAARHGRKSRQELIGRSMLEVYPGIQETEMFGLLEQCMTEGTPQQMLNRFDYPDGERRWFDLRMSPVPEGVLVLSVDVTPRMVAEEQLHQAQKMEAIGRLAGGVAHDFNNLISVITSYTDLVLGAMDEDERFRQQLQEIRRAAGHAASLTRQLLAFSRKRVYQPEILDLTEIVQQTSKMLRRVMGETIELITDLESDLDPVLFDAGQIQQVLMNLAVNARDAMPGGGTLTITTANVELDDDHALANADASPGPHVMLAVADTGVGMDQATRARIFEPFFTTKERGKGTGLGLATTYGIVKQSGGSISVHTEPDRGTTFEIYLPRADSVEAPGEEPGAPAAARAARGETVLVVEDDPGVRDVMRQVLETGGYTILDAATAEEAVALARDHDGSIDVLLTDLVLPGMDGRDMAERIREQRPETSVLYTSGYTDDSVVRDDLLDLNAPFLEKPFTADALLTAVRRLV